MGYRQYFYEVDKHMKEKKKVKIFWVICSVIFLEDKNYDRINSQDTYDIEPC